MPEPRDKLDTTTVNGPEDEVLDWDAVNWRQAEDNVRRLRQRIFTASKAGDLKKVRNLQKLMLCSRSNALVSVRRVTEVNAGRKTAGVDGRVVLSGLGEGRDGLLAPARRHRVETQARQAGVHPQSRGETARTRHPRDRRQGVSSPGGGRAGTRVEGPVRVPIDGFRPGRSCQDAMQAVFVTARGKTCKRLWALDADLAAAFDRIDHSHGRWLAGHQAQLTHQGTDQLRARPHAPAGQLPPHPPVTVGPVGVVKSLLDQELEFLPSFRRSLIPGGTAIRNTRTLRLPATCT